MTEAHPQHKRGKSWWPRLTLTQWIVVAMIGGVLLGWLAPASAVVLDPFSKIFLNMIKCLVVPLIFSTLVVGIAGHSDDLKAVGRLAFRSLIYFEIVTTLALAVGLFAVNLVRPGEGVTLRGGETSELITQAAKTEITWQGIIIHTFPTSFFDAAAKNEVLQIVVFTVIFAASVTQAKGKSRRVMIDFCESLSEIMFKFTAIVMLYAPIGIGAAIGVTVGKSGLGVLKNLAMLVLTLYGALFVFVVLVLLPVALIMRVPLRRFWLAVKQPALIAFSTASSEAALPQAMQAMERIGVPKRIVAFVMPTGYSFNLDGSTLYLAVASVFAAQVGGIEMPLSQQLLMMLTLMLTSKGVAAVPRASLVILSGTLASFGLPLEAAALILGVDAVMDMARTSINLVGNCLATVVMARWEGEFNDDLPDDIALREPEDESESAATPIEDVPLTEADPHLHGFPNAIVGERSKDGQS